MQEWLEQFVKDQGTEATKQVGRYEGQVEAYDNITKRFNPDKFCQVCGEEYAIWRNREHPDVIKAEHDAKHTTPTT